MSVGECVCLCMLAESMGGPRMVYRVNDLAAKGVSVYFLSFPYVITCVAKGGRRGVERET